MADDQPAVVEYRLIEGFPGYRVGNDGTVWTLWTKGGVPPSVIGTVWRQRKTPPTGYGYYCVSLRLRGKVYNRTVHSLVARAFLGPPPKGMEVCHGPRGMYCNHVSNLSYGTRKQNMADRVRDGCVVRGEKHGMAKLKETDIPKILALRAKGLSYPKIGLQFDVTGDAVRAICNRKRWAWVANV